MKRITEIYIVKRKRQLLGVLTICSCVLSGCGKDENDSIYNFYNANPKDIDPWVYIQDTALSSNSQIIGFASSASRLGITLGVMGIVFSILYMVIRILFSGKKTKSEIKEEAIMKGITAIMIFSIPLWLGICKLIGELLV